MEIVAKKEMMWYNYRQEIKYYLSRKGLIIYYEKTGNCRETVRRKGYCEGFALYETDQELYRGR